MTPALQAILDREVLKQYAGAEPERLKALKKIHCAAKNSGPEKLAESLLTAEGFTVFNEGAHTGGVPDRNVVIRQFKFCPTRGWSSDFALPYHRLLIEIEGGIWFRDKDGRGAHSRPANILRDIEKQNMAVSLGWLPLRFAPAHVKSGEMIRLVLAMTKAK